MSTFFGDNSLGFVVGWLDGWSLPALTFFRRPGVWCGSMFDAISGMPTSSAVAFDCTHTHTHAQRGRLSISRTKTPNNDNNNDTRRQDSTVHKGVRRMASTFEPTTVLLFQAKTSIFGEPGSANDQTSERVSPINMLPSPSSTGGTGP